MWILGLAMIGTGLLVLGCGSDPVANYYLLAFFFDGVPVPPELKGKVREMVEGPWGEMLDPDDPRAKAILAKAARRSDTLKAEELEFAHLPFKNRQCTKCHSAQTSFQVPITGSSCRQCHSAHYDAKPDDRVHGPVALGNCAVCHAPHKSQYKGLLNKPQKDQCFFCHDAERTLGRPYHAQADTKPCSSCHDPHASGNKMLLADAATYVRRKSSNLLPPAEHAAWDKKSCRTCHLVEQSNQLVADVDSRCLSCHEKVRDAPASGRLHKPVREGKCTVCHMAHRSSRPKLTRPDIESACFSCHKIEEMLEGGHPPMHRADCSLCHTGHSSARKHLLNELGGASWQSRRKTAAAPTWRVP